MANFLHRTTKQYLVSTSPNSLPEPISNYIEDPDLSVVTGWSSIYWVITGDIVTLMNQAARDTVDADILTEQRDSVSNSIDTAESYERAFALVVMDEINILRAQHSLSDRTPAQLKVAVRAKLDG